MSIADATSAIVPTYARAKVAFERGEGCWLVSTSGERYLDFGAGIAVTSVGHAHPHLVEALDESGLEALARFEPLPEPRRRALRQAPHRGDVRRSRFLRQFGRRGQRGGDQDGAPAPFGRRPSRALSHAHLRRRVPWPHARHDRRRRPGQISRRLRPEGRRLRPDSADRPQGGRGGDRAGDGHDHDRADPGRGRSAGRSAGVPARLARDLRPPRLAFDLRRSADGRRPHRAVLRLRALRRSSGHSDLRQRHRRGLSDVGVPGDRGRGSGTDRRRPRHHVRRQSAWRWRSATPPSM